THGFFRLMCRVMRKKLTTKTIDALPPPKGKRYEVRDTMLPGLHPSLIHSVNARSSCATRRQNDPGGFGKPFPVGNEPQETIEPTVRTGLGPCCKLVLHFADYQRSSPHLVR